MSDIARETEADRREWEEAERILASKTDEEKAAGFKIRRDDHPGLTHSFAYINGMLLRMEKGNYLGIGGNGKVKTVTTKEGEKFALKIEASIGDKKTELEIMKLVGYLKGTMQRDRIEYTEDRMLQRPIKDKFYSVQKLLPGKDMYCEYIYPYTIGTSRLDKTQRGALGLLAMLDIQFLHNKGIIHGDIKPQNFMASMGGGTVDTITVSAIDFGNSLLTHDKTSFALDYPLTTCTYSAPESGGAKYNPTTRDWDYHPGPSGKYVFSFASDVYALGVMLRDDLHIREPFVAKMCDPDPAKRISLLEAIYALSVTLPEEYLTKLDKTPDYVLEAVAQRTSSPDILTKIISHPNTYSDVLTAVAANPNTNITILSLVAINPHSNETTLQTVVAKTNNTDVLIAVANNERATAKVLTAVAEKTTSHDVLLEVIKNPNVNIDVLRAVIANRNVNLTILDAIKIHKKVDAATLDIIAARRSEIEPAAISHPLVAKALNATSNMQLLRLFYETKDLLPHEKRDVFNAIADNPNALETTRERCQEHLKALEVSAFSEEKSVLTFKFGHGKAGRGPSEPSRDPIIIPVAPSDRPRRPEL